MPLSYLSLCPRGQQVSEHQEAPSVFFTSSRSAPKSASCWGPESDRMGTQSCVPAPGSVTLTRASITPNPCSCPGVWG